MWHTYRQTYLAREVDDLKNPQSQKQTFIEEKIPDYGEVDEFLDRIVERKVRVVVLLEKICLEESNDCVKYKYYWQPNKSSPDDAKDIKKYKIIMNNAENRGNYKCISLRIEWYESGKVVHNFKVFIYTLSKDVPFRVGSFMDFLNDLRIANNCISTEPLVPIVVHSNGGVGLAGLISIIEIGMDMIQFCGDPRNIQRLIEDNVRLAPSMMHINQEQMKFCLKVFDMYAKEN